MIFVIHICISVLIIYIYLYIFPIPDTKKYSTAMCYIGCIYLTFLHCALSCVSSNGLPERMQSHIGSIFWLFSAVYFQMCPQMACMRRGIITLIAFMWLYGMVSRFLQDFWISILQTQIVNIHLSADYYVLCFGQWFL